MAEPGHWRDDGTGSHPTSPTRRQTLPTGSWPTAGTQTGRTGPRTPSSRPYVPPPRSSRRPEMIRQRRAERLKRSEQQRRGRLFTRLGVAGLVGGGGAVGVYSNLREREARQPPAGVEVFACLSRDHVDDPVESAPAPPVGGALAAVWQNCGDYPAPVASETAVHSLEHGAVWIAYRPDLLQEQIGTRRELAEERSHILASPFPDLPVPVVASAWSNQLPLDSADSPDLARFIRAFRLGPQTPGPGAAGAGGTLATA